MPLTKKGNKIMRAMEHEYGEKKGESVFYASKNSGKIHGVEGKKDHGFYGHTSPHHEMFSQRPIHSKASMHPSHLGAHHIGIPKGMGHAMKGMGHQSHMKKGY